MKLKKQLILSHLCVCIIPILIITLAFFAILYRFAVRDASSSANQIVEQISRDFENVIVDVQKASDLLEHEISLQQALREPPSPFAPNSRALTVRTNSYLEFVQTYSTNYISDIFVLGAYVQYRSNDLPFSQSSYTEEPWYQQVKETEKPLWFAQNETSLVNDQNTVPVITVAAPLHHTLEDKVLGISLFEVKRSVFEEILTSTASPFDTYIYLTDADEQIFLSSPNSYSAQSKWLEPAPVVLSRSLSNGWELHVSNSIYPFVMRTLFSMSTVLVVILFLVLSITIWFSLRLSQAISTPINALMASFKAVENGDLTFRIPISTSKYQIQEISSMNASFNAMVEKLSRLLDQTISEQQALRKAQLTALQAQINPHFLYNTLDTISWSIRLNRQADALLALQSLTQLFRISISKGRDVISIQEEFEHVEKYLILQKLRYSDKLEYFVDLPESLAEYSTLKLILQPLVENAIYHGIKNTDRMGQIRVFAQDSGEDILFVVHDNGAGMSPAVLDHLNALLHTFCTSDSKSYGVVNVSTRIKMAYGAAYGIRFESVEGEYTTAYITIPKKLVEKPDDP